MADFQGLDFLHLDELYREEELLARDSVRSFVSKEFLPRIQQHVRQDGSFPMELVPRLAELGLFDRQASAAEELGERLLAHYPALRVAMGSNDPDGFDIVVNATPLGMHGYPGVPIPEELIAPEQWIADVIYTPLETQLIKNAKRKGCRTMTGGGMCVHQAAESFRLFTGMTPDVERMRALFERLVKERDAKLFAA